MKFGEFRECACGGRRVKKGRCPECGKSTNGPIRLYPVFKSEPLWSNKCTYCGDQRFCSDLCRRKHELECRPAFVNKWRDRFAEMELARKEIDADDRSKVARKS